GLRSTSCCFSEKPMLSRSSGGASYSCRVHPRTPSDTRRRAHERSSGTGPGRVCLSPSVKASGVRSIDVAGGTFRIQPWWVLLPAARKSLFLLPGQEHREGKEGGLTETGTRGPGDSSKSVTRPELGN